MEPPALRKARFPNSQTPRLVVENSAVRISKALPSF
jgi:hypothetical protein